MMRRAFFCLLAVLLPVAALAADEPFRFLNNVDSGSVIHIDTLSGLRQTGTAYECVTFTNAGTQPVTRVLFRFTYYDATRANIGADTFDRVGRVEPGAQSVAPEAGAGPDLWHNANCQHFNFPKGMAFDVASVEQIDFADNTSWSNPSEAPLTADQLVTHIQPRVIAANMPATRIKVLGAAVLRSGSTDYICPAFENQALKTLTFVRFKLFYLDMGPKSGGDQTIEVRSNVKSFARIAAPNTHVDASTVPSCAPLKADRSQLEVAFIAVDRVEFADGTLWQLPKSTPSPSPSPSP